MTAEEIFAGESDNVEFKSEIPAKSEKYMKTVVAFANGKGGKLIFGVENGTWAVTGFSKEEVFQKMDAITNAIFDSCEPKITPNIAVIAVQEIDGKAVIVVEIIPGMQRPYYIKSQGIMEGTYIRVAGTTRHAERYRVQELIMEGTNRSFDQMEREQTVSEEEITAFCEKMYQHALKLAETDTAREQIQKVGKNQLLSWKLLVERDGAYHPTNGYLLLNGDTAEFPDAAIQCAVFKGTGTATRLSSRMLPSSVRYSKALCGIFSSPAKSLPGRYTSRLRMPTTSCCNTSTSVPALRELLVKTTMSCRSRPSVR